MQIKLEVLRWYLCWLGSMLGRNNYFWVGSVYSLLILILIIEKFPNKLKHLCCFNIEWKLYGWTRLDWYTSVVYMINIQLTSQIFWGSSTLAVEFNLIMVNIFHICELFRLWCCCADELFVLIGFSTLAVIIFLAYQFHCSDILLVFWRLSVATACN